MNKWLTLLLYLLINNLATAQINHQQVIQQHWSEDQGLPVGDINGMVQDQAGYIWLASFDGLIRFDGVEFTQFDTSNSDLPSNRFTTIRKTDADVMWLSTDEGDLVRFANGKATTMKKSDGMPHERVVRVTKSDDYGLAYGTIDGVALVQGDSIIGLDKEKITGEVTAIHWQNEQILWVTTASWLYQIINPTGNIKVKRWPLTQEVLSIITYKEQLWIGTADGIYVLDENQIKSKFQDKIKGPVNNLRVIPKIGLIINSQGIWQLFNSELISVSNYNSILIRDPLFIMDHNQRIFYQGTDSLLSNGQTVATFDSNISDMILGKEGDIWVATISDGIYRFMPASLHTIGINEGLPVENLYPLFQATDESIWVGTDNDETLLLNQAGQFIKSIDAGSSVNAIAEIDQQIWMVSDHLCIINSHNECDFNQDELLLRFSPFTLINQDQQNRVWLAGRHGSMLLRANGQWQLLNKEINNWHVTTKVQTVMETIDGDIWFGTNGDGLIRFRNNQVNNDPNQWGLKSRQIRSLLMINQHQMLVGTQDGGLCRIDLNQAINQTINQPDNAPCINNKNNLNSISIHHLHRDLKNRIWWSSNRGVFWQPLATLMSVFDGELDQLPTGGYYDKRSGMRNSEANGGVYPSALIDKNNQIWFPTQQGLALFDLDQDQKIPSANVQIQSIATSQTTYNDFQMPIKLSKHERNIQVKLSALSYFSPSNIEFRYRFANQSEDWLKLGTDRLVSIRNLSTGSQNLEFSARNAGGDWQRVPASLKLIVSKFWYETIIAKILGALILLLMIGLFFRWRHQLLLQRANLLEQTVKSRTLELKQISEKRTEFFANISHELRTPLTLILGPMEDALADQKSLAGKDLKLAYNSAHRMKRLVDQMLDLQKIDAKKLKLQQSQHDLFSFLSYCIEPFQLLARQCQVDLTIQQTAKDVQVKVLIDSGQMEKVIGNLLSNAFKFAPQNSEIKVTISTHAQFAIIAVLDQGTGIKTGTEKRIFNRFSQGGQQMSAQGTGIGLALVKEITELHGGNAKAENRTQDGACFSITLPLVSLINNQVKDQQSIEIKDLEKSESDSVIDKPNINNSLTIDKEDNPIINENNKHIKILIVEDNADLRQYIASHLQPYYQLYFAQDGVEGLAAAKKHIPDIIISDVMMPNMNGFEMAKALRSDACTDFIPLVFLTAKVAQEDELKGFSLGADDYINKPFTKRVLLARINAILEARKRLQRSGQQSPELIKKGAQASSLKDQARYNILKNLSDPDFDVSALASSLFMSRSKLQRQLKAQYNTTPSDMIRSIRMSEADKLLRQGSGSVSEVCCAVGYSNLSSFSTIFKKTYGVPPTSHQQ